MSKKYAPFKMYGHTLPGIKQNSASPLKDTPAPDVPGDEVQGGGGIGGQVAGAAVGALIEAALAPTPKAPAPRMSNPAKEMSKLEIGTGGKKSPVKRKGAGPTPGLTPGEIEYDKIEIGAKEDSGKRLSDKGDEDLFGKESPINYRMKGFSGFHNSPLKQNYTSTKDVTSNLNVDVTNMSQTDTTPRLDYGRLVKSETKTPKYMGYKKFKTKTKGVGEFGEKGATKQQYKDWKKSHGFKSGVSESLKKVDPQVWGQIGAAAVGPIIHALLKEDEKAPAPRFGSAAEGFSQIQIGTGQKI